MVGEPITGCGAAPKSKASSALTADLEIVTSLPDRVTGVTNRTTEILSVVQSSFAPAKK